MSIRNNYGVTVDIGTTNIVLHLVRLRDRRVVNQYVTKNPQMTYGLDIISRIKIAQEQKSVRDILVSSIRDVINRAIGGMATEQNIRPDAISDVVIVGNTVMHHLFFDKPIDSLLNPPYSIDYKESITISSVDVGLDVIQKATVYSPPIVESFVGPDSIAVLFASSFLEKKARCMTIDVGTNTEVSVIAPQGIWIASAASGPAFEGMAIQCGIGGEIGAIKAVSINPKTYEPTLSIIDDSQPRGICGTGAISALAELLDVGLLLPRGSFNRDVKSRWTSFDSDIAYYVLARGGYTSTRKDIVLSQPDVRLLQQSKAAIRAAIDFVLQESGTTSDDISNVFLTGVFGSDLRLQDAYKIGMFPPFSNAEVTQSRNGAIHGADILLEHDARDKVTWIVQQLHYIELMDNDDFNSLFVKALAFPSRKVPLYQ